MQLYSPPMTQNRSFVILIAPCRPRNFK
jgi:hypothetical protein